MEQRGRLHCHSTALELAVVNLVLIIGFLDLRPDVTRFEQVVELGINNLGYDFDDCAAFWEVPNRINVNIDTFLFSLLPKLGRRVLLFIIWDELCCVFTFCIRV